MKIYSSLNEVIADMDELSWAGTLFTNDRSWNSSPQEAKFIYLEGDDELDDIVDDETMLPRLARENDAAQFLGMQVFRSIILNQREVNPKSVLNDFIHALNYYLEYDTFYWK